MVTNTSHLLDKSDSYVSESEHWVKKRKEEFRHVVIKIRVPGVSEPLIGVEDRGTGGIKHLYFFYVPISEVNILIKQWSNVISGPPFTLKKLFFLVPMELTSFKYSWAWYVNFLPTSVNNIFLALPCHTASCAVTICFLFQSKLWKMSDQPSHSSAQLHACSSTLRTWCLKYDQHRWTPTSSKQDFREIFPIPYSQNTTHPTVSSLGTACCWRVSVLCCKLPSSERPLHFTIPSAAEYTCIRTDTLGKIFTLCSQLHLWAVSAKW